MDRWSPTTLVRYGLCCEDESGRIVSIWNFGELEEALNGIDSDSDIDDVVELPFDGEASITHTNVSVDVLEGGSTVVVAHAEAAEEEPQEECEVCHYVHSRPVISRCDVENVQIRVQPCPVCEYNYRKYVEDFYADMPRLLPPDASDYGHLYPGMPDLKSSVGMFDGADVVTTEANTFFIAGFTRLGRVCDLVAKFVLLQLICGVYEVPSPVFTNSLDALLCVCLLQIP